MDGTLLLLYATLLIVGVLFSELTRRTVLSTAVLFLLGGLLAGPGITGLIEIDAGTPWVATVSELALFAVLFSDGMKVGTDNLRAAWRLPGRALLMGMPLTFSLALLLAHFLVGLPWITAVVVSAALAPTDPVFASAIVGRQEVPQRLRHLLNVESGVNDGLALPLVLTPLLAVGEEHTSAAEILGHLGLGVALGIAIPAAILLAERLPVLAATDRLAPLVPAAVGLLVLGACVATDANLFLAAFAAGLTVDSVSSGFVRAYEEFGELIGEQLKLFAVLIFGALVTPPLLADLGWSGWLFAVLALVAVRPISLSIALLGTELGPQERATAAWFGPKGFASVVYGLVVLDSGLALAGEAFHLIAGTVALSMVLHSSTDVLLARLFDPAQTHTTER